MNECEGLNQEVYDLYALDLLESPQSEIVSRHLETRCSHCQRRYGQAVGLWTGIAVSEVEASGRYANPALKRRIMKSIEPARPSWLEWFSMRETWAAAASVLVLMGATAWFYGHRGSAGHATPVQIAQAPVQPRPAQVAAPAPVTPAIPAVPTPAPPLPAAVPAGPTSVSSEDRAKLAALERELAAAVAAATQSEAALRSEMGNSARLTAELARQKATLDAALQAPPVRPAPVPPDAGREGMVQRVRFLEEENLRLRRDVNALRQRADQGLQLATYLSSPGTRLVKLRGTDAAGRASGQVLVASNGRIMLFTSDLPTLPAGREYQLWILRGSGSAAVMSAGVFRSTDQKAEFQVADAALLNSLTSLAITEEPAGGSPKPTGHKLLIGTAQS